MTLLHTIEKETGANPTVAVIWMHGLGADANDFVPMIPELDLAGLPPIRFIFPNAETMPVTINGGYVMRAWYDIVATDLGRQEDEAGLRASQRKVEALLARENARGIPHQRIILAGFSQGCAMALQTGLRQRPPLAGLMCLSGYRAHRGKPPHPDLPGARPHGPGGPAGARHRLARPAAAVGLPGRVARLPDATRGLPGRSAAHQRLAPAGPVLVSYF